jgi:hypothetical protein
MGFQEPCTFASHRTIILHEILPRELALLYIYALLCVRRTALDFRRMCWQHRIRGRVADPGVRVPDADQGGARVSNFQRVFFITCLVFKKK